MNKRNLILVIVLILVLGVAFGPNILDKFQATPGQNSGAKLSTQNVEQLLASKESKLKVVSPVKSAKVSQKFAISGEARLPGQIIRATLKDGGKVIARGTVKMQAQSLDWVKFTMPMTLKKAYKGPADLEVYWLSNKNGARTDIIKLPVNVE